MTREQNCGRVPDVNRSWHDRRAIAIQAANARSERDLRPISGAGWMAGAVQLPDNSLEDKEAITLMQGGMLSVSAQGVEGIREETLIAVERETTAFPDSINLVFYDSPNGERLNVLPLALGKGKTSLDIKLEHVAAKPHFVRITPIANSLQFSVQELFPLG